MPTRRKRPSKKARHRRASSRSQSARDEFPKSVVTYLANEVGNCCSLCAWPTSGPSTEPRKNSNAGTAAHITAASKLGPRFDENLSPEQRRSHENGIWCCRTHGKLVDDDISTYNVAFLRVAKARAIERARRSQMSGDPDPDGYRKQAHITRHNIAKEVVGAVHEIRPAISDACHCWQNWRIAPATNLEKLLGSLQQFQSSIARFKRARDEVRAVWGEHVAAPLQMFGDTCSMLLCQIGIDLQHRIPKEMSDRDYEEWNPGTARHDQLHDYATLLEEWAAPYLGREGTVELTEEEMEARGWRIAGFPEDQVQEIVEQGSFVRAAQRAGYSRAKIKQLLREREAAHSDAKKRSSAPLDSRGISGDRLLREIGCIVDEMAAHGETSLRVRLPAPLDEALEAALMSSPGGYAIVGEHIQALAKKLPAVTEIQLTAGGLPQLGWTFRKTGEAE